MPPARSSTPTRRTTSMQFAGLSRPASRWRASRRRPRRAGRAASRPSSPAASNAIEPMFRPPRRLPPCRAPLRPADGRRPRPGAAGPPSVRDPRAVRCGAGQARSKGRGAPSRTGRPSIPPEMRLRATRLRRPTRCARSASPWRRSTSTSCSAASSGSGLDDAVRHPTTVPYDRARPMEGDVAREFRAALVALPEAKALMSAEHSSRRRYADRGVGRHEELRADRPSTLPVDGTPIEAWPL